jgi:hypothetical protein
MRPLTKGVAVLSVSLLSVGTAGAAVTTEDVSHSRAAAHYIAQHQADDGEVTNGFSPIGTTADAVLSFVAARRGPRAIEKALDYLEAHEAEVTGVGLTAKVVMALVAGGRDPRSFAGRDLVEEITSTEGEDGRYGADTAVFDHALAMLALAAAGQEISENATDWLANAQCPDGGWQYDRPYDGATEDANCFDGDDPNDFFASDTNTTSYARQALLHGTGTHSLKSSPFGFFRFTRDEEKGGWGYTAGYVTDSNSTALVIQTYAAVDRALPKGAKAALRDLQYPLCRKNGAFAFTWTDPDGDGKNNKRSGPDTGATVGAVLGLLEKPLPLAAADVTKPARPPAC